MKIYPIPMVPGPVRVPERILRQYGVDYGSADLEREYLDLYNQTEANLQTIMQTTNKVVIHTGEGMLVLWGALKSCLLPGDRVLAISTGVFGAGFGEMARSLGAEVRLISLPFNRTIQDWDEIERAIVEFHPKMITAVHCETPSGTLNPIAPLGDLKRRHKTPLLIVDVVASLGGAPVQVDEWGIDLALGASQKALSAPPDMSFLSVSPLAWEIIQQVNYPGYDALKPFLTAQKDFYFPYTPYWQGMAALYEATQILLEEGLQASFQRHDQVACYCREQIEVLGLTLFPTPDSISSPTVTAVQVPEGISWVELDRRFRSHGLAVAGSYGPLTGKVFRLGHMGSQADMGLVEQAIDAIRISL